MCKICDELDFGHITSEDALKSIGEVLADTEDDTEIKHMSSLIDRILHKEIPQVPIDDGDEDDWWIDFPEQDHEN